MKERACRKDVDRGESGWVQMCGRSVRKGNTFGNLLYIVFGSENLKEQFIYLKILNSFK